MPVSFVAERIPAARLNDAIACAVFSRQPNSESREGNVLINILDHVRDPSAATAGAAIQGVLDDTQHGDKVWFPAVFTYTAPQGGWKIRKSLEIYGDGPGGLTSSTGTVLKPYAGSPPSGGGNDVFVFDFPGSIRNVHIHDLAISGLSGASKTGRSALRYVSGTGRSLSNLQLNRLLIADLNGDAISLIGASDSHVPGVNVFDVEVRACAGHGMTLTHGYQVNLIRTRFTGNGGSGIYADLSGITMYMCAFDANSGGTQAFFDECHLARFDACLFRNFGLRGLQLVNCGGNGPIGGCRFVRASFSSGSIGIEIGSGSPPSVRDGALLILPNTFSGVGTSIFLNDSALGCIVFPQTIVPIGGGSPTTVRYPSGTSGDNASTFALPSAHSIGGTSLPSGLLLPRLTANPVSDNQPGMLYHMRTATESHLRAYLPGTPAAWRNIDAGPSPNAITDLTIPATVGRTTLLLNWTAPGSTEYSGSADQYDIRYSTSPITEANFSSQPKVTNPPTPSAPGTSECCQLSGLQVCKTYYAAIKAKKWTWSGISNFPSGKTKCSGSGEVDCT